MALTTIPAAGAPLRGAILSALITEVRPLAAYKTGDETLNADATLQNDNELFVSVEANAVYLIEMDFVYSSGATPDIKTTFTGPTGMSGSLTAWTTAAATTVSVSLSPTSTLVFDGTGANAWARLTGYITTSSTAGTLQFQWAQNVSNASNTIVRQGSYLNLTRVS